MSVVLNPSSTLGFHRPLTTHVKRTLAITNANPHPVAFKVKTTAPKLYCVRPNSGRVEPGETTEVQVMLQAMKEEPPLAAKCKDKFLIQSTLITPEKETLPLQDIWNTEGADDIHSQKIRVAYLPPEGQAVPEEEEEQHSREEIQEHVEPRPSAQYSTAQRPQNGHAPPIPSFPQPEPLQEEREVHVDASATPPPELRPEPPFEEPQAAEPPVVSVNVHTSSPAPPLPPPSAPALSVPDRSGELQTKLDSALVEIERLRNIISSMPDPSTAPTVTVTSAPSEVRRRGRAISDDGSTIAPETELGSYVEDRMVQPEGVPLQVVIIVALGVFITTYLFF